MPVFTNKIETTRSRFLIKNLLVKSVVIFDMCKVVFGVRLKNCCPTYDSIKEL